MSAQISGLFAAPITPLNSRGTVNFDAFERLLDFLLDRGIEGICVGGATSEYPQFDLEERRALISLAASKTRGRAVLLASVGACSIMRVRELAGHALKEGARALLLPAPHFFPCEQSDLEAFCREVSRSLPAPYLLYNLPDFTSGFETETTIRLLQDGTGFIGIKDSSGDPLSIEVLAKARGPRDLSLLIGNDSLLFRSLAGGWNGVISGTANICPELFVWLFRNFRAGDFQSAQRCQALIDEVSRRLTALPFPWGIRLGVEIRGISPGPLSLPVSSLRKAQIDAFRGWFEGWLEEKLPPLSAQAR